MQTHLAAFLASWSDESEGCTLPRFVTDELRAFLTCGIPAHGFAQLYCDTCKARHIVAFCCRGLLFDAVPLRQWVLTLPFPSAFSAGV